MLRVLHAADLHLGAPCQGLPPEKAAQRRRELTALPERLRLLAEEKRADLLLLPGDLFDRPQGCSEEVQILARALGRLSIPVFIAPGNHDFYAPHSPYTSVQWSKNVHLFTSPQVERVALPQLGCVVYGAAFVGPQQERSLLDGFQPQADTGLVRLLCLHGELTANSRYNPLSPQQLTASGLHYIALGHNHTFGGAQKDGHPFCCWPGCPEGHGFDETGAKGVLYVEVDAQKGNRLQFCPLSTRQYRTLTVDVTPFDTLVQAVNSILPATPSPDIVRVTLTGSCPESETFAQAEQLLTASFFSASLLDETVLRQALWSRAGEDSLTGQFLRLIQLELATADDAQREHLELTARLGLAALEGREVPR